MAMDISLSQPMLSQTRSRVSSISSQATIAGSSVSVKIGGLWKRSQGLSRFTKPNYRHRVFILTDQSLSYYKGTVDRVGQLKGRIDLASIRAVEFVEISAFNLAHTLQIVYYSKKNGFVKLYVTATDKSEAADWVSALRQVCYFNRDMLMHYHPGAYVKNKWTCCKQRGQVMLGCQPTYHLLTRSSSRYAQMRRKDTITNKQQRIRNTSGASAYSTVDRRSGSVFDSASMMNEAVVKTKPGQGLSNSCMDLAIHPPHRIESFLVHGSPSSKRSSRFSSVDPSISRVSFASSEGGMEVGMSRGSTQSLKRRSRSQVAPETQPTPTLSDFPDDKDGTVSVTPSTVKPVESNTLQLSGSHSDHSRESDHEPSPPPIPPPRYKRGASNLTQSHSIHFVSRVPPISEAASEEQVPKSKSSLKHSNTFIVQRHVKRNGEFGRKIDRSLSHSMSALTKPLIEPKLSSTNPNVIHV